MLLRGRVPMELFSAWTLGRSAPAWCASHKKHRTGRGLYVGCRSIAQSRQHRPHGSLFFWSPREARADRPFFGHATGLSAQYRFKPYTKETTMRLFVLAALAITAFVATMAIDFTDANAVVCARGGPPRRLRRARMVPWSCIVMDAAGS